MHDLLFFAGCLTGGYVLAIYSWPALRSWLIGIEAEIVKLDKRAADLEAYLRRLRGE